MIPPPKKPLQLCYKQIHLNKFQNFGSKKTLGQLSQGKVGMVFLAHCRSQSSSQKGLRAVHVVTNPIQSTKQLHNSSFILIADCLSFSVSLS